MMSQYTTVSGSEVLHTTNSQNQTGARGGDIPSVSNTTTISDGGQTAQPQQPNDDGGASQHKTRSTRPNAGTNRVTKARGPKKDHYIVEREYRKGLNDRFAILRGLLDAQREGKAEVLDRAIQALTKKQSSEAEMTAEANESFWSMEENQMLGDQLEARMENCPGGNTLFPFGYYLCQ
ncbi:hypothetical protein V8F33_014184 [Rhypophila sp. PSN 637]